MSMTLHIEISAAILQQQFGWADSQRADAKRKASVTQLVRKEHSNINKVLLEGVTVDNTIGSLAALYDPMWFWDVVGNCMEVYNIGRQILG